MSANSPTLQCHLPSTGDSLPWYDLHACSTQITAITNGEITIPGMVEWNTVSNISPVTLTCKELEERKWKNIIAHVRPYQNIHLFELVFLAIWTSCQWNIVGCVLPAVFRKADYRMKGDDERRITQQNPPHLLSGRPLSEKDWEIVPRIQMAGCYTLFDRPDFEI